MFFVIKEHLVWGTKDVNIGGNGLTNINFASISNKVKFIDIMKYFLTSLGQLAGTLDEVEAKKRVEKITLTFLNQHSHFSKTWNMLNSNSKTLYTLLKMRDLSDLNNFYNAQAVILLLEIM